MIRLTYQRGISGQRYKLCITRTVSRHERTQVFEVFIIHITMSFLKNLISYMSTLQQIKFEIINNKIHLSRFSIQILAENKTQTIYLQRNSKHYLLIDTNNILEIKLYL